MCDGCKTRQWPYEMGECPVCGGQICDARHCPRQIACIDCERVFSITQWYTKKVYTDDWGVDWSECGHTLWDDTYVVAQLERDTN